MKIDALTSAAHEGEFVPAEISQGGAARIMDMLATLYKDPFKAVVREYTANGRDAHIAKGVTAPVEVWLPTDVAKVLRVRDYGAGMTREEMSRVYETFAGSTKGGDNDAIGGFGIGSKSAYSISPQFLVRSIKDGLETTRLFMVKDGMPGSILLSHGPSDEPSGTLVEIPVVPNHNQQRQALEALQYFPTGSLLIDGQEHVCVLDGEEIAPGMYKGRGKEAMVVMGGVGYPVEHLAEHFEEDSIAEAAILAAMIIEVPIGSVPLVPSRESVKATKESLAFLSQEFERGVNHARDTITAQYLASTALEERIDVARRWFPLVVRTPVLDRTPLLSDSFPLIGRLVSRYQRLSEDLKTYKVPLHQERGETLYVVTPPERIQAALRRARAFLGAQRGWSFRGVFIIDENDLPVKWDAFASRHVTIGYAELLDMTREPKKDKVVTTYRTVGGEMTFREIEDRGLPIIVANVSGATSPSWAFYEVFPEVLETHTVVGFNGERSREAFLKRTTHPVTQMGDFMKAALKARVETDPEFAEEVRLHRYHQKYGATLNPAPRLVKALPEGELKENLTRVANTPYLLKGLYTLACEVSDTDFAMPAVTEALLASDLRGLSDEAVVELAELIERSYHAFRQNVVG